MNLVQHTLTKLEISSRVLCVLLGISPDKAGKVERWKDGAEKIPEHIIVKLEQLPAQIPFRNSKTGAFKFIDLFAGIGGIRLPFQEFGGECVFTAEWDKYSKLTYAANFGETSFGTGDITKVEASDIGEHDILLAGFPCQAFSQAGKREGFKDTRGTMFFEIQRILSEKKPRAFLLENVKQLKGHDGGKTLATILAILRGEASVEVPSDIRMSEDSRRALSKKLNYNVDFTVLRARDFGVPQTRERIYIVGFDKNAVPSAKDAADLVQDMFSRVKLNGKKESTLSDALEADSAATRMYTISEKLWDGHKRRKEKHILNGNGFGYSLFNADSQYCNTISARYYKDGSEILIEQPGLNPRKITPREAANIQGFPKDFHIGSVSDTQAYRQFGNSVAVPVIEAIAREMLPILGISVPKIPKLRRKQ